MLTVGESKLYDVALHFKLRSLGGSPLFDVRGYRMCGHALDFIEHLAHKSNRNDTDSTAFSALPTFQASEFPSLRESFGACELLP